MNGGGIVISNNSDGRGMMIPEREGSFTFNKLPFISMSYPKKEVGLNPSEHKVIINSRKIKPHVKKEFIKYRRGKLYPLEHYRKIKTSQQFWKKNENPYFKKFNKKKEDEKTWIEEAEKYQIKGNNVFKEMVDGKTLNYSDIEYIKSKKLLSAPKTPQKLVAPPIFNNTNNNTLTLTAKKEEKPEINENMCTIQQEKRDVKVCLDVFQYFLEYFRRGTVTKAGLAAAPAVEAFRVAALGKFKEQVCQIRLQIKTLALPGAGIQTFLLEFNEIHSQICQSGESGGGP